jgi:hypothetical protein
MPPGLQKPGDGLKPKPPAQANPWSSNNNPNPPQQDGPTLTSGQQSSLKPPPVPQQDDVNGQVVVNTDALDTFASNVNTLIPPVKDALTTLSGLPKVAAGGFPEAYTISDQVSGGSSSSSSSSSSGGGGGGDLADSYNKVLNYLADGLTDVVNAANSMSKTYSTTDELNNATAADVTNSLNSATNDFNNLLSADGGSPPASSSAPPPAAGS